MNETEKRIRASKCESFRKLNPHLFSTAAPTVTATSVMEAIPLSQIPQRRIRQDQKPLLNKLETEWLEVLQRELPGVTIHSQSWRVRIANGAWFKVDHIAMVEGVWTAWECKGPKQMKNVDRGMLALKCAAAAFPEIRWILVWKDQATGAWQQQLVRS